MAVDDAFTKVLLHFNGADGSTTFTDESGKVWTAHGDAQLDIDQYVFGPSSGLFDGTVDYISTPDTADFDFGTGDFSIDFRIKLITDPGNGYWTIFQLGAFSSGVAFLINVGNTANIHARIMGTSYDFSGIIALDTWYHIALTRSGTDLRLFLDGIQQGVSQTCTEDIQVSSESWIGKSVDGCVNAWFDEFRVSGGIARWTTNFTPPATYYGPLQPTVIDFDLAALNIVLSAAAEALFLDFAAAPLTFYPHIEFGAVEVNFEDHPFEFTLSASLTEMFYLDMGTAPLLITTSFDPDFEGRGENIIEAELPALTMTSVLAVRSLRIDADLPELTMASSLLVGEILSIEAELPALEIEAGLTVHIFGSITAELPGLECRAHLIVGQLISIDAELPALTMVSHIFQVPKMAIDAILPALYMTSSLRVRAAEAKFRTTVLNLKNMAVTKYEDFNFNSLCYFNGVYLGANENGIYILGGDTDAGADIDWSFKTPKIDFLNAIPADIWLSLRNSQALAVKVEQNEDIEHPYTYLVNADTDPKIHMERVKLGRGLDARVMQMTVSGTGAVDLNGISIVTNPLKKSKR